MRAPGPFALLMLAPLAVLAGCGEPDESFARVEGRIVAIEEACAFEAEATEERREGSETKRSARDVSREGDCAYLQNLAQQSEYRNAEVRRELDITYEYVSPVDRQPHRGTGDREQPVVDAVPRVGDSIEVLAHRTDASASRLP